MEILRFAILGLGTGAVYALLAQGLVLVYRGSGLLNFAQGAVAMAGAYVYYDLTVQQGLSKYVALSAALISCAALGACIHLFILRPMAAASALSRVIATLAVLVVLQSAANLRYGYDPLAVPSLLPTHSLTLGSPELVVGADRLWILGIGVVLTAVLYLVYKFSSFGRVTSAVAENQVTAASLGHSPDVVATINWAIGSALAALAGVLIAPILYLDPTSITLLVIQAMAAALLGQFASFPITLGVALAIGVAQAEIGRYVDQPGWATAAPFFVVIVILTIRGRSLPLRSMVLDRLPEVGSGRIRPITVMAGYGAVLALVLNSGPEWATAWTLTIGVAIIGLSIVLVTGYAGQLSLTQSALAGLGALIAAKFADSMPFLLAMLAAAVLTAVVGAVVSIPALRSRGATLAIVTLGLAAALYAVVLKNSELTGGVSGILVPIPNVFGWDIDPFFLGHRYAAVTLTIFTLLAVAVANLRRGSVGRQLLAVRSNERAAAALGLNNTALKTYAFALGGFVAAVGGVLLAFQQPAIQVSQTASFTVFAGIFLVAVVVLGGPGYIGGAVIGATFVGGGVTGQLLDRWPSANEYLPLVGGITLLVCLVTSPNGLFPMNRDMLMGLWGVARRRLRLGKTGHRMSGGDQSRVSPPREQVAPRELVARGVSVSFGGVRALREVDLSVKPGEIHGLIGPNGAGKTTLIDALTGFVDSHDGEVLLGGQSISGRSVRRRARAGISRSFQSLELFLDLTVAENLALACEQPRPLRWLTDLVWPGRIQLTPAAELVIEQFELTDLINEKPESISFGERKKVAIARAVCALPSVLLLDEPAAGLDDHEAAELAELIRRLAHEWGIGVLLVEHNIEVVMGLSDRLTVLADGTVLASGDPAEVSNNPAVLAAYLGTPVTGAPTPAPAPDQTGAPV